MFVHVNQTDIAESLVGDPVGMAFSFCWVNLGTETLENCAQSAHAVHIEARMLLLTMDRFGYEL